ncbi:MAG TPA: MFS transporter [Gaiellaceae bacterium]|nr:MFS transporter [Gaiellaceae bacterium]
MRLRRHLPAALQGRNYLLLWCGMVSEGFGVQMVAVAIGWQVYAINRSALDLGLVGLFEFIPLLVLALPAGQLADRVSRRLVFAGSLALNTAVTVGLLVVTLGGASELWPFLALAAGNGAAQAGAMASARALGATLVSWELLPSALALRSVAFQGGAIVGPALGGLLFAIKPELVYMVAAVLLGAGLTAVLAIHEPPVERAADARSPGLTQFLAGIRFIRRTPVMLGAITLDLFAVLFGGAVALLPLFAREILHTGPVGLGVLRGAPAVGALLAGLMLTRRPVVSNTGTTLLVVVGAFGVATVVFGLSKSFPLSVAALAVGGFVDMVSVNIRSTIATVAAPDELRGRVSAVESVFISASNELGAFESGAAAALLGAVPAVVAGGVITIVLAGVWRWLFPELATIDRIDELRPEPTGAPEAAL